MNPQVQRKVSFAIGLVIMLGLIGAGAVSLFYLRTAKQKKWMDIGYSELKRGISGNQTAFADARKAFLKAGKLVLFDSEPMLMVALTERLELLKVPAQYKVPDPVPENRHGQIVLNLIRLNRLDDAGRLLKGAPKSPRIAFYRRLVERLK